MLTEVTIDWTMTHYTDPTGADLVRALQNDVRPQTSPYPPRPVGERHTSPSPKVARFRHSKTLPLWLPPKQTPQLARTPPAGLADIQ